MKLALAEQLVGDENDSAVKLIHEITDDAKFALEDLEALVHGMYPAILVDRGLAAAFTEIGRSAPMPVRVLVEATPRYPAEVEAAVYFACAEALQNAAKHAGGTATARIALRHGGSGLAFEVRDDGGGFADAVNGGSGLANMQDRLSSVGGQLRQHAGPPQLRRRTAADHLRARLRHHRSRLGGRGRAAPRSTRKPRVSRAFSIID
jgi:signal transduction histidine kinase